MNTLLVQCESHEPIRENTLFRTCSVPAENATVVSVLKQGGWIHEIQITLCLKDVVCSLCSSKRVVALVILDVPYTADIDRKLKWKT